MTLFNQAIEILESDDEDQAWEVAKMDSGLCVDVTKSEWLKYAKESIARREHERSLYKKYSKYSR
jgi:hypothetical protein